MRAIIKKVYKGQVAVSIERSFSDAPSLYEFLLANGVKIEFRDAVSDSRLPSMVYTVALVQVEADNEYQ